MAIDAALGRLGIKEGVCTSSTRPANPFEGQLIYETDTNRTLVYDNAAWLVVADNQVLSIDPANNRVGISTTSPSSPLHIKADSFDMLSLDRTDNANVDQQVILTPTYSGSGNTAFAIKIGSEIMRVTEAGNVGINDTTPSYELDVNGDINATGDLRIGGAQVGEWINYAGSQTFGAGLTVGNGTLVSAYARVKDIVFMRGYFVLGSTSAVTGNIDISVPFPSVATIIQEWPGHVRFWDQGGNVFYGGTPTSLGSSFYRLTYMRTVTAGVFELVRNGDCSASAPFGWATGDAVFWSFSYQAA